MFYDDIVRNEIWAILESHGIDLDEVVECSYVSGRELGLKGEDYALIRGPEILLTCCIRGVCGQAFTVAPRSYKGLLKNVLSLDLDDLWNRGVFYATTNALAKMVGLTSRSMHCHGVEPEYCGEELARYIIRYYGSSVRILHVGYHPSHVEKLYSYFKSNLLVTDLRDDTVWRVKKNILVYDGLLNKNYIGFADVVVLTSSAVVNKTIWDILSEAAILGKTVIAYGVSGIGALEILKRKIPLKIYLFCPYSR